jgi:peroxin-1
MIISRPDMIDPALLRPGRLDKAILCDLPDLEDRMSIIEVVSKTIPVAEIGIRSIAEKTDGFTGADLQALFYTAQLQAINEYTGHQSELNEIEVFKNDDIKSTIIQGTVSLATVQDKLDALNGSRKAAQPKSSPVLVSMKHLHLGLKQTKPSLRKEEYLKFKQKYNQFKGEESISIGIKSSFQ